MPVEIVNMMEPVYDRRQVCEGSWGSYIFLDAYNWYASRMCVVPVSDHVMRRIVAGSRRGMQWSLKESLENLDFEDDICFLS